MSAAALILASTSRYRRELLGRLGLPFTQLAPEVDEDVARGAFTDPHALADALARRKALAVHASHPGSVVIGSDQVCALGDEILGKPGTPARARAQLARLAGHEHRLITAVAIAHDAGVVAFEDVTRLWMRRLDVAEIERYVAADDPIACAGSYRIESLGVALFARIESDDHTAIVGLPLMQTSAVLRELGFAVP